MDYLKLYLVIDKENILNKIKNINNNFTKNEYYIYITDNGIIKKLVTDAIWSNFSAQSPAIIPNAPRENEAKKVNINK